MSMIAAAIIGGVATLGSTIFGAVSAGSQANKARDEKKRVEAKIDGLERTRQPIINPYSNVKDISSMASDLSGMMSNPYGDLGVATGAAEIQMEQSDMALANTLDTLRATGASAGGATALAQAALQSKKGVSASIEKQEANNEKLKAQGEAQLQAVKLSEAQRVQGIQLSEAQRMQQADVSGQQYMFGATENRETSRLDRLSGLSTQASVDINAAQAGQASVISGGINALGNIAGSYMQANATNSNQPTLNPDGSVKQ
tara:strand:+ start:218 stop:991 length:774 start_codon:yes stop_codon:yes gene_type:complete